MMQKLFLLSGAITGGLAVAIGAFGAHALRATLEASSRMETFETGVKYQFYHALALLVLGALMYNIKNDYMNYAGYAFIAGTIIFSGSLYILCLTGVTRWGMITPIGGVLFIAGWIFLALGTAKGL